MIKDILSKWPFAKLRIKNRDKYDQGHSFKMPLLVYAKLRNKNRDKYDQGHRFKMPL